MGEKKQKKKQIQISSKQVSKISYRPVEVVRFLETLFLQEMGDLVNSGGNSFIKFLLIIQGIEFLGACEDKHPFEMNQELLRKNLPRKRFNRGLKFFRKEYHQFTGEGESVQIKFFEDLRSTMVHQFRPNQTKIRLSDRASVFGEEVLHLAMDHQNRLILVLEDFYHDFAKAVKLLMQKIESGEINASKLTDTHITIESIQDLIQTS